MSPSLSVVADNDLKLVPTPKAETVSERVRRLQAEAKQLAKDHVRSLSAAMVELEQLAAEIAEAATPTRPASARSPASSSRTWTAASRPWKPSPPAPKRTLRTRIKAVR